MKHVHITGKRWFDRKNGNTYFSCLIWVNSERVHHIDYEYGYGNQYLDFATDWLEENEHMPGREYYPGGGGESIFSSARRNPKNFKVACSVADVGRKKDL